MCEALGMEPWAIEDMRDVRNKDMTGMEMGVRGGTDVNIKG